MTLPRYDDLGDGILCIDTGLYRHGLAACYLIQEQERLVLVDTGTAHTAPRLLELIAARGLRPEQVEYVIPTHVHLDHAGGAGNLMAACPNARLVIHPKGARHMIDPEKLTAGATAVYGEEAFARDFGRLIPVGEERVIPASDGMVLELAGRRLTFLDTPGHANHHGCLFDERSRGFFTGDTFGIAYRELNTENGPFLFAPTTPVAFDPEAWQASLDHLMRYAPQAMYLTHYGRLERPQDQLGALRESIRGMAGLALAEESGDADNRLERLRSGMADFLTQSAHCHAPALDTERIEKLLAVDIELNAQGLEVWLKRRARAAANA